MFAQHLLVNPDDKVIPGEIQCKMLGASIEVWDDNGKEIKNKMGELVLSKPFISMPLCFGTIKIKKNIKRVIF